MSDVRSTKTTLATAAAGPSIRSSKTALAVAIAQGRIRSTKTVLAVAFEGDHFPGPNTDPHLSVGAITGASALLSVHAITERLEFHYQTTTADDPGFAVSLGDHFEVAPCA